MEKEYSLLFWSSKFFYFHVLYCLFIIINPGILQSANVVNSEAIFNLYNISSDYRLARMRTNQTDAWKMVLLIWLFSPLMKR